MRPLSYKHMMYKQAISVTLHRDNVTWLKGRADAAGCKSVSDLLDRLVTAARTGGQVARSQSVIGTIEIDPSDPSLEGADRALRDLFESSVGRSVPLDHMKPRRPRSRQKIVQSWVNPARLLQTRTRLFSMPPAG